MLQFWYIELIDSFVQFNNTQKGETLLLLKENSEEELLP